MTTLSRRITQRRVWENSVLSIHTEGKSNRGEHCEETTIIG
jgi:hypothetical protein